MRTRNVSGFAMAELLVLIAVIAVLAVAFAPVLARARQCRFASTDLNSAMAARAAASLYSEDYDGLQPRWNLPGESSLALSSSGLGNCLSTAPVNFVSANGGCQDTLTGLTWSAPGHEVTGAAYLYGGAVSYCSNLNEQGYTGWRMATKPELSKFAADGAYYAVLDNYPVEKWSSTQVNRHTYYAVTLQTGVAAARDIRSYALDAICVK